MKVAHPVDREMLVRIQAHGEGWVFSPGDFIDLGTRHAVDKALSRMTAAGSIRRDYPDFDPTREIVKLHGLAGNVSAEARY